MKWRATIFCRMIQAATAKGFTDDAIRIRPWLEEVEETDFAQDGLLNSKEACQGSQIYDREKHKKASIANSKGDKELFLEPGILRFHSLDQADRRHARRVSAILTKREK